MNAREKLDEFAEMRGWNRNKLIGWSEAAGFAEWYAEQQALRQPHVSGAVCNENYDDFDAKDDLYAAGYDGDM